ncbi:MAG: nuclear transport factor 2 family protein [Acidimicrobiales bacterium]
MSHPREEIEAAVAAYVDVRERIERGEADWPDLADLFTDDAIYNDPAWGRIEGADEIRTFMRESMVGLDDWRFPIEFTAIDGDHVVIKWTQIIPGTRPDGTPAVQSGYSHLLYAGDGKFSYEEDLLNMTHVLEDLAATGWAPVDGFNLPPANPDRDWSHP